MGTLSPQAARAGARTCTVHDSIVDVKEFNTRLRLFLRNSAHQRDFVADSAGAVLVDQNRPPLFRPFERVTCKVKQRGT